MSGPTNPAVDLVALHTAILADLAVPFPPTAVGGVPPWKLAFYLRTDGKIQTPGVYLEMTDAEPASGGGDIGTGQWNATLHFEAYVLTDYKAPDYRIKTRLYALQLAAFLVGHQWGATIVPGAGGCRVKGAYPDKFVPDAGAAQYDCMRVEWEQDCLIGPDSWAGGVLPTEVYLGFPPNVGTGNEGDYIQIAPE
jgi:hypothetical protein